MAGWRGVDAGTERKQPAAGDAMAGAAQYEAQHMTIDTHGQMVMKSKQQLKADFGITSKPIATLKMQ
ncbi:Uncharacterized protein YeaC [Salmonella enterica subsp. enterica]|uniref:Uncharacterized protein YeaC n=1 Tax=Salmonella enterica I TaxID=59201 RepID=A0A379WUW2_SALET|nr:Uncharacterized protein YeaC [Salmonella enterica subsp. enterica]